MAKARGRMCVANALLLLLCVSYIQSGAKGLRMLELTVPAHVVRWQPARLECRFDLEGDTLYSVKWYKEGREFFRYLPLDKPPAQLFPLPGIALDMSQSTWQVVQLTSVQLVSSGRYRCEVSAEAPAFETVSDHGPMQVVALPEEGPRISGGKPRYALDEWVRVNCTSGRSRPPAQLMWFINDEQAKDSQLRGPFLEPPQIEETYWPWDSATEEEMEAVTEQKTLQAATLGLEFRVRPHHFKKGDLKIRCLASIATVYWRSNEESVEGERPQRAPALPSRPVGLDLLPPPAPEGLDPPPPAPASRADRVHASNGGNRRRQLKWQPLALATAALLAGALVTPRRGDSCS